MKYKKIVLSVVSILFFMLGVVFEIAVSGGVLWGELETRVYTPQSGGLNLVLHCPLILSFTETGTISTLISNSLDEEAQPMVIAELSRNGEAQEFSEILDLTPRASKTMLWNVDASNMIFGRLILVSVLQRAYRDLPSRQGYCGILLLNILGLNGKQMLILLCSISLLCLILGAVIWFRIHAPMNEQQKTVARSFGSLATFTSIGLIAALLRWWGFIIILDGIALILVGVIFTEVLFNPRQGGR